MIAALTLLLTIVILGIPVAIVFIPWAMITGNATPLYIVSLKVVRLAFRLARIRVETTGLEHVPRDRACIFMSNHISNLDPPALLPRIPGRTSAFIKRSLTKIPVFGYGLKLGDFVPVDRDGQVESAIEGVQAARTSTGERNPHHHLCGRHAFARWAPAAVQEGAVLSGQGGGCACHPDIHPRNGDDDGQGQRVRVRPGTAHITFHEPLDPARFETREELMEAVRAAIASGLPEWMRSAGTEGPRNEVSRIGISYRR